VGEGVMVGLGVGVAVGLGVIVGVRVGVSVGGTAVGDDSAVGCGQQPAASRAIPRVNRQAPKSRVLFPAAVSNDFRIVITP
jgi:hypothetical protein